MWHIIVNRSPIRSYTLALLVVLLGALGMSVAAPSAAAAPTGDCAAVAYFGVGGASDVSGTNIALLYPADVAETTFILYPAIVNDASVTAGEKALTTAILARHTACPNTAIKLRGHSLGALIVGNVCDEYAWTTCQLTGDPRRPQVNGEGGIFGATTEGAVGSVAGSVTFEPLRAPSDRRTEICIEGDAICNSPALTDTQALVAAGLGIFLWHSRYSARLVNYDDGKDHVVSTGLFASS